MKALWQNDVKHLLCILLASILLISSNGVSIKTLVFGDDVQQEEIVYVKVIPSTIEYYTNATGEEFTIAVVVEDTNLTTDLNLYGVSLKLRYNKTYLAYVSHTTTIPVESFPNPIAPSPYPGILHKNVLMVKDEHDPALGQISIDYASMAPAPSFNGSGTILVATFRVIYHPEYGAEAALEIYSCDLAEKPPPPPNPPPPPIPRELVHGVVILHQYFEYPVVPLLDVRIQGQKTFISNVRIGEAFNASVWLMGVDPFWDVSGFDMYMWFNQTLIEALSINIDPDEWFRSFWPNSIIIAKQEINNTGGYVHIAFAGLSSGGAHTPVSGQGCLFTVTFNVTFESSVSPPPETVLSLLNPTTRPDHSDHSPFWNSTYFQTDMAGFPHPERPICPWHSFPWPAPIPHVVSPATYIAPGPPIAIFEYSPIEPVQFKEVIFNASKSYSPINRAIISYEWDFGDGTTGTGEIVTHVYDEYGSYDVTLTVTDEVGMSSSTSQIIYVREWQHPVANFTFAPMSPIECEDITFDASLSYSPEEGEIVDYVWDFGDGTTGSGQVVTHKYLKAGRYLVVLTVVDEHGSSGNFSMFVDVQRSFNVLEVEADVGSIHFAGEIVKFRMLLKYLGEPVNATAIIAALFGPEGTSIAFYVYPVNITLLVQGLYEISYTLPATLSGGEHTLVVTAEYYSLKDSTLKSFLVSSTLNGWDARLKSIEGNMTTLIIPSLGEIKVNLTSIRAQLVSIDGSVGVINSTLGEIIIPKLDSIQSTATMCLTLTSALSAVAAVISIIILVLLRKRR